MYEKEICNLLVEAVMRLVGCASLDFLIEVELWALLAELKLMPFNKLDLLTSSSFIELEPLNELKFNWAQAFKQAQALKKAWDLSSPSF